MTDPEPVAVTVIGTNLVMDYGTNERAVAAMDALAAGVTLAPSLDEGLLARALATTPINFGQSVDWWTDLTPRLAAEYRRLAQEGETAK